MWIWMPKTDITLYELAMALNVLFPAVAGSTTGYTDALINAMPPGVARHFEKT